MQPTHLIDRELASLDFIILHPLLLACPSFYFSLIPATTFCPWFCQITCDQIQKYPKLFRSSSNELILYLRSENVSIHCLIHMFQKKITKFIYLILSIVNHENIDFFSCHICHDCRSYRSYE